LLGVNPTILLGSSLPLEPIIKALGSHPDPSVRLALLDSYLLLFARVTGRSAQDALLSAFTQLFDNPSRALMSKLAERDTYAFFGPGKLVHVIPSFVRLLPTLLAWRDIERSAATVLSFPVAIVRDFWRPVLTVMLNHFAAHCHPLARCATSFLPRLCNMLDPAVRGNYLEITIRALGGDSRWGVRRLLPLVIGALPEDFASVTLPALLALLADPVASVTIAALNASAHLRIGASKVGDAIRDKILELTASADDGVAAAALAAIERSPLQQLAMSPVQQVTASLQCLPDLVVDDTLRLPVVVSAGSATNLLTPNRPRWHSSVTLGSVAVRKTGRGGIVVRPKRRVNGIAQLRLGEPGPE
jgi:hypothetical protein